MEIGDLVPSLPLKATSGINTSIDRLRGKWLVLYFYPKDATPGCTTEGCDFRDNDKSFAFLNTDVFGISRDSLASHEKFKMKENFPFELISDADEELCRSFDVIKMKSMYGKEVRGIERSTFIIDPDGYLRHIWRKVKVLGHVDEVLNVLRTLQHDD
jgi:peroxiredoxin Q/BCP